MGRGLFASAGFVVAIAELVAPAHGEHLERRGERRTHPLACAPGHPLQELPGVPVLPAEALDVRRVRLERLDARVEGVGGVDAVVGLGGAERPHLAYAAPRLELALELLGEDPPVPGIAHRVEHGPADGDVVGLVEVAAAPGVAEVPGDHDVWTVA